MGSGVEEGTIVGAGVSSEPCKPTTSFCGTPTRFARGDATRPARTAVVPVRLTPGERDGLQVKAKSSGLSLSEFIRRAALKRRLPPPPVPEINRRAYEELARIGNNLNQLLRAVHSRAVQCVDGELLRQLGEVVCHLALTLLGADDASPVPVPAGLPRGRDALALSCAGGRLVAAGARRDAEGTREALKRAPGTLSGQGAPQT